MRIQTRNQARHVKELRRGGRALARHWAAHGGRLSTSEQSQTLRDNLPDRLHGRAQDFIGRHLMRLFGQPLLQTTPPGDPQLSDLQKSSWAWQAPYFWI